MRPILCLLMICIASSHVLAGVGDPTVRTDHPHYAGEGAFQTARDCVDFAAGSIQSEQERAIAVFQWLLAHQFHLASPQECYVPGKVAGSQKDDYEMVVYDAARGRFSYGYGLCGTVHAWNEPYWRALGMRSRRRSFPGHTNSEIEYGGSWHAFDTDMAGLVFRPDGVVAGYEDVMKDPSIVKGNGRGLPCYPFAWPGDFNGMKKGWQEVAKGGKWYSMYHSGYEAMPGIVNLRRGETFTRYFDRDHFGGPTKRRFWHVQKGGPFRDWTFVNQGEPRHEGEKSNSRGNASYCNAEFIYVPDFAGEAWREGVQAMSANIASGKISPRLRSADAKPASVVFTHFSPYVICGDPVDDENPMTGRATGGLVLTGKAVGSVKLEVSINGGQSWQAAGVLDGSFERDLTEQVKGNYGYHLRLTMAEQSGLDELRMTTVGQVNQAIYPRLKPGGSMVTYRAGSRSVLPVIPDFGLDEKSVAMVESVSHRSANLKYTTRSSKQRLAFTTTNNKPGQVVFRIGTATDGTQAAMGELLEVSAAARFQIRVPPPAGCDFRMDLSTDGGKTWQPLAKAEVPADNEYSTGWMYGRKDARAPKGGETLVRVNLYAGGYTTGLISAEMYGIMRTPPPRACKLTVAWKEGGKVKTHSETIAAGKAKHVLNVPTGATIIDEYVRMEVE